jgi:hypothetical protein
MPYRPFRSRCLLMPYSSLDFSAIPHKTQDFQNGIGLKPNPGKKCETSLLEAK